MSDRIILRENYSIVVEEVTSTAILHDMFVQISDMIEDSNQLVTDLDRILPQLTGLQFVTLTYYNQFVSPSNFNGYALLALAIVPDEVNDIIQELILQADDSALARIFLLAVRNTEDDTATKALQKEANYMIKNRLHVLRSLQADNIR